MYLFLVSGQLLGRARLPPTPETGALIQGLSPGRRRPNAFPTQHCRGRAKASADARGFFLSVTTSCVSEEAERTDQARRADRVREAEERSPTASHARGALRLTRTSPVSLPGGRSAVGGSGLAPQSRARLRILQGSKGAEENRTTGVHGAGEGNAFSRCDSGRLVWGGRVGVPARSPALSSSCTFMTFLSRGNSRHATLLPV